MTTNDVDTFEKARGQLDKMHSEMSVLSKSKPDSAINKFKLGFINEILKQANTILTGSFKPFKEFELFDVDELPSNSDAVIILSQYLDCLEAWRSAHTRYENSAYYWNVPELNIRTQGPSRYRKI